jgi:hypothetical protein
LYVLLRHIPKSERFTLGADIRASIWLGLRLIIQANSSRTNRLERLDELDEEIKVLQGMIRTGRSLKIIDSKKYKISSAYLVEIGRMLGGWIKSAANMPAPSPASRSPGPDM